MCTELTLPDGQTVESTAEFAELVALLGGIPGAWKNADSCLCGVDIQTACASVGLQIEPARAFRVRVPAQAVYPARYVCADGPCVGQAFPRRWGHVPDAEVRISEWGPDDFRSETVYRLDGEVYRLVSAREWRESEASES